MTAWLILLVVVPVAALVLRGLKRRAWELEAERPSPALPAGPTPSPESVLREYRSFSEWFDPESDPDVARYRLTVVGCLPKWISIDGDLSGLQARVVFGATSRQLPIGWTVKSSSGDLILESRELAPVDGQRSHLAIEAAEKLVAAYRAAPLTGLDPDPRLALIDPDPPVLGPSPGDVHSFGADISSVLPNYPAGPPLNVPDDPTWHRIERRLKRALMEDNEPTALRLMKEHFPTRERTDFLLRDALTSTSPGVRLSAAEGLGEEGDATLHALLLDKLVDESLREAAAQALGDRKHLPSLLAALESGPKGIEVTLLRALMEHRDERIEPAILPLLDSEESSIVEATADLLVREGTRSALAPLQARRKGPSLQDSAQAAISVAIEVITERVGGGQSGALALADRSEVGRLSASPEAGALSEPGKGTPPKTPS